MVAVTVVVVVAGEVVTEDEIEEGVAGEVVYDVLLRGWCDRQYFVWGLHGHLLAKLGRFDSL